LIGHTTLNSQNKGDIKLDHVPHIPPKRKKRQKKEVAYQKRNVLSARNKRCVVEREQIHDGTTGSESCLQDMKRRLRIILVWCSYHIVLSSIEK
jgi:hypothetical protein